MRTVFFGRNKKGEKRVRALQADKRGAPVAAAGAGLGGAADGLGGARAAPAQGGGEKRRRKSKKGWVLQKKSFALQDGKPRRPRCDGSLTVRYNVLRLWHCFKGRSKCRGCALWHGMRGIRRDEGRGGRQEKREGEENRQRITQELTGPVSHVPRLLSAGHVHTYRRLCCTVCTRARLAGCVVAHGRE